MPAVITNFPLVAISDIIISFLQYSFGNPEITPSAFRWNQDDRQTKIFIGGPYTITRDKVGALPTITIARGNFAFQNRVMDNLEKADGVTFENPKYRDLLQGTLSIICEAGAGPEATGLASFVGLELQANRHKVAGASEGFVHRFTWTGIGPETPVKEEAEVTRWQCVLSYNVTLCQGWLKRELDPQPFNKVNIYGKKLPDTWESIYGEETVGSPNLIDQSADFGFLNTNNPQILEGEFDKRWYYVTFGSDIKKYTVEQIVNNKTLKLSYVDANGDTVDFNPSVNKKNVSYKLFWNSIHLNIELPKKS